MKADRQTNKRTVPQTYMHITYDMRLKLISLVNIDKISIPQSCKQLGIKKSTAKCILREFRRKGKIFCRKNQKAESKQGLQPQNISEEQQNQASMPENKLSVDPYCQGNNQPGQFVFQGTNFLGNTYPAFVWAQNPFYFPAFYNYYS